MPLLYALRRSRPRVPSPVKLPMQFFVRLRCVAFADLKTSLVEEHAALTTNFGASFLPPGELAAHSELVDECADASFTFASSCIDRRDVPHLSDPSNLAAASHVSWSHYRTPYYARRRFLKQDAAEYFSLIHIVGLLRAFQCGDLRLTIMPEAVAALLCHYAGIPGSLCAPSFFFLRLPSPIRYQQPTDFLLGTAANPATGARPSFQRAFAFALASQILRRVENRTLRAACQALSESESQELALQRGIVPHRERPCQPTLLDFSLHQLAIAARNGFVVAALCCFSGGSICENRTIISSHKIGFATSVVDEFWDFAAKQQHRRETVNAIPELADRATVLQYASLVLNCIGMLFPNGYPGLIGQLQSAFSLFTPNVLPMQDDSKQLLPIGVGAHVGLDPSAFVSLISISNGGDAKSKRNTKSSAVQLRHATLRFASICLSQKKVNFSLPLLTVVVGGLIKKREYRRVSSILLAVELHVIRTYLRQSADIIGDFGRLVSQVSHSISWITQDAIDHVVMLIIECIRDIPKAFLPHDKLAGLLFSMLEAGKIRGAVALLSATIAADAMQPEAYSASTLEAAWQAAQCVGDQKLRDYVTAMIQLRARARASNDSQQALLSAIVPYTSCVVLDNPTTCWEFLAVSPSGIPCFFHGSSSPSYPRWTTYVACQR